MGKPLRGRRTRVVWLYDPQGALVTTARLESLPAYGRGWLKRATEHWELPAVIHAFQRAGFRIEGLEEVAPGTRRAYAPGTLWHLRKTQEQEPGRDHVLRKRRPRTSFRLGGESHQARVSLAPSPGAAAFALDLGGNMDESEDRALQLYVNAQKADGYTPSVLEMGDVELSGEIWSRQNVPVVYVGRLPSILGLSQEMCLAAPHCAVWGGLDPAAASKAAAAQIEAANEYITANAVRDGRGWRDGAPWRPR